MIFIVCDIIQHGHVFVGFSEWEDDQILAAVLAASQQDYLNSLKKNKSQDSDKKSS